LIKKNIVIKTAAIIFIIIVVGLYFYNFHLKRKMEINKEQLEQCEENLKHISTALEMYAMKGDIWPGVTPTIPESERLYPPSLSYLTKNITRAGGSYMKALPRCPVCYKYYGYEVADNYRNYTIWCSQPEMHVATGQCENGCWPQYNTKRGIMVKPDEKITGTGE